jgi:hypothetical protein
MHPTTLMCWKKCQVLWLFNGKNDLFPINMLGGNDFGEIDGINLKHGGRKRLFKSQNYVKFHH